MSDVGFWQTFGDTHFYTLVPKGAVRNTSVERFYSGYDESNITPYPLSASLNFRWSLTNFCNPPCRFRIFLPRLDFAMFAKLAAAKLCTFCGQSVMRFTRI